MRDQFVGFFQLSLLVVALNGCSNPTVAIDSDKKLFKKIYPNQIQTFQGKNRVMGYAWSGDQNKRPILFVHGSPGSWEGWSHFLLDPQLQKQFHLIAIDRTGYGQSMPGTAVTSLAVQAADVIEVLKFNNSQKSAILVGHSFGGPVIAKAAIDFPDQIAGLVFVSSSVSPELETTKWFQYPATWWPIRVLIPSELRVCNEEILPLKSELTQMLPDWKRIKAKSVLIQGEEDELVPSANLDFLIENLENSSVIQVNRVSNLNHFVPWKRPDLITKSILEVDHGLQ